MRSNIFERAWLKLSESFPVDIAQPLALLSGLTPQQFMRRHWQKRPLLVRNALAHCKPLLSRTELFDLAGRDDVESRLIAQRPSGWTMRRGPIPRRSLPRLSQAEWTLLVQGVDLHDDGVHALMQRFRFVPDARLDDVMISYATEGGGVGPHFDSYDVFLLQMHGRRRWRYGRQRDFSLVEGLPLKILANFEPEYDEVLEPGDMLYLPPKWAHDGVALDECMTYSIGFRQPSRNELARELLQRMADAVDEDARDAVYTDPAQPAVEAPGAVPAALHTFAEKALRHALSEPDALARALGEWLTDPKPKVWFDASMQSHDATLQGLRLDRASRMMYDTRHVFINGEAFRAGGRDARLMRQLADARRLTAQEVGQLSAQAQEMLEQWADAGWLHWA